MIKVGVKSYLENAWTLKCSVSKITVTNLWRSSYWRFDNFISTSSPWELQFSIMFFPTSSVSRHSSVLSFFWNKFAELATIFLLWSLFENCIAAARAPAMAAVRLDDPSILDDFETALEFWGLDNGNFTGKGPWTG